MAHIWCAPLILNIHPAPRSSVDSEAVLTPMVYFPGSLAMFTKHHSKWTQIPKFLLFVASYFVFSLGLVNSEVNWFVDVRFQMKEFYFWSFFRCYFCWSPVKARRTLCCVPTSFRQLCWNKRCFCLFTHRCVTSPAYLKAWKLLWRLS